MKNIKTYESWIDSIKGKLNLDGKVIWSSYDSWQEKNPVYNGVDSIVLPVAKYLTRYYDITIKYYTSKNKYKLIETASFSENTPDDKIEKYKSELEIAENKLKELENED